MDATRAQTQWLEIVTGVNEYFKLEKCAQREDESSPEERIRRAVT